MATLALNLSSWDTSQVTTTQQMFNGLTKLTNLDIRKATFTKVSNSSLMFNNVPSTIRVTVKDSAAQTFIKNALGSGKGTVVIG